MDIGKAFTFVFEDKEWLTKILIAMGILLAGVLLSFLVIPSILAALLLSGYALEITRRTIRGQSPVLPDWDNWGQLLVDGLQVAIIGIVYALPMIAVSICLGTPLSVISAESEVASSILGSILGCLNLFWGIVLSFLLPAAIASFAAEDELAAAFRFDKILALVRDHFTTYLITAIMVLVATIIGGLGVLFCGVGWLLTVPYSDFVIGYLYGQAYREASGQALQVVVEEEPA